MSYNIDNEIKALEEKMNKSASVNREVTSSLASVSTTEENTINSSLTIAGAKLEEMKAYEEQLNENILSLVLGLEKVTNSFGDQFNEMKQRTLSEKLVGFFSKQAADSKYQDRLRNTDVSSRLQDLIRRHDVIIAILQKQLVLLNEDYKTIDAKLDSSLKDQITVSQKRVDVEREITEMDPKIIHLQNIINETTEQAERAKLEEEYKQLVQEYNAKGEYQKQLAVESQSLENYIEKMKIYIESLESQRSNQLVLINKLQKDAAHRAVLYPALVNSLKTSGQQEVAHRVNEIGRSVDNESSKAMAAIQIASDSRMTSMMEQHEGDMVKNMKVQKERDDATEALRRRFGKVIEKLDLGKYEEEVNQNVV